MNKVADLIYKPGARRGDLLKECLGLLIKGEFPSVVFRGKRRRGMWKEHSGYLVPISFYIYIIYYIHAPPTPRVAADGLPPIIWSSHLKLLSELLLRGP